MLEVCLNFYLYLLFFVILLLYFYLKRQDSFGFDKILDKYGTFFLQWMQLWHITYLHTPSITTVCPEHLQRSPDLFLCGIRFPSNIQPQFIYESGDPVRT